MRINSGKYRGANLFLTNLDTTRETSDMVRQAIFNLLPYKDFKTVLDLFAGSGAMGFEALSRGASFVYFNDLNKKACDVVLKNAKKLKCENQIRIDNLDYKDYLKSINKRFDFIILDPPYKMDDINSILNDMLQNDLLNDGALISFEMNKETKVSEIDGLTILKERTYGIKKVVIYKK